MDRKRKLAFLVRGNRGQAIIEFAFVLPMLLLVLFGITEFGRAWMTANILTAAAREGCRLAVVTGPDSTAVIARVTQVCGAAGVTPTAVLVSGPDPFDIQRRVTVTVQTDFTVFSGTILGTFTGTIPLGATMTMRHEGL
ncbi:MAG: pilus assembly protein [Candidatus Krumholzibacteriota bacterium]|nr:pilus assembly protein [Candidatus Krumholzibacteriota bacterium]